MTRKLLSVVLLFCFSSSFSQHTISGLVTYNNSVNSGLDSVDIFLSCDTGLVAMTTTNAYGFYEFTDLPNGDYFIGAFCSKTWGGVNSSDALMIMKHFVGLSTLTGLRYIAADLDGSGVVNSGDALLASQRFVAMIHSFVNGDWAFEPQYVTLNDTGLVVSFSGICTGDVNGSFLNGPPVPYCGQLLVDSRDGSVYNTVLIGEQCWMVQNLNLGTAMNGLYPQTNNNLTEKYCYNNDPAYCAVYGGLYQWGEMMQYDTTSGSRGICPAGWHIPTEDEWDTLVYRLGGPFNAAAALNSGGTTGFSALSGGHRIASCSAFQELGQAAYFWSSTQYLGIWYAWARHITAINTVADQVYEYKMNACSVRCLKNAQAR